MGLHLQLDEAVLLEGLPCMAGRGVALLSTELRLQLPQQLILLPAEVACTMDAPHRLCQCQVYGTVLWPRQVARC